MERRPAAAGGKRAYDNFVPSHEVVREKDAEIFLIQLPGFKKEHIRIQIDDFGRLEISGERPVADNLWSRFLKQLQVPDYCNVSEIKAKFEDGLLYIIKPMLQTKPSTDGEAGKAPETTPDRRGTTEKKGDDGENGVSRKSKPKRKESDGGVGKQSIEKERDRIEGPEYGGRNGRRMTGRRKEAETAEPTSPGRGNMLTTVRGGFYRRKQLVLNAAIAMVILVGVVWLYVTRSTKKSTHAGR